MVVEVVVPYRMLLMDLRGVRRWLTYSPPTAAAAALMLVVVVIVVVVAAAGRQAADQRIRQARVVPLEAVTVSQQITLAPTVAMVVVPQTVVLVVADLIVAPAGVAPSCCRVVAERFQALVVVGDV